MIKFSKLFETVYEPRSGDEKNFKDKHVIMKIKVPYPQDTESQFTSDKPKAKRKADQDDDVAVYEAADVHTKRADKEPVIVRSVNPKTGQSETKTVMRRAGEIKIEEVELEEGIDKMSNARLKFHAEKNFPHGSYTRKEIQDEHKRRMRVEPNYHTVKPSLSEESDLDEKVVNPYAVGMAAAMKATGDRPPLKKSTIIKGHEIAKGIQKEAMDPVGKEDSDINNDGKVDSSDKYLKNRRKAIGRALQKEDNSLDQDNSSYTTYKKSNKPNAIKKNPEDVVKEGYTKPEKDKVKAEKDGLVQIMRAKAAMKAKNSVKEDLDLDEAAEISHDRYMRSHGKKARDSGQGSGHWMFTSKQYGTPDYENKKEVHTAHGKFADAKKSAQQWAKEHGHRSVYVMESAEQLDELSPDTLHSYIKKAAPDVAARTISAVAPNQSAQTKKHASKLGNRVKGITGASGRLADKANSTRYEEAEQIDEISVDLARRYIRKASAENSDRRDKVMSAIPMKDIPANNALHKKFKSRQAGIGLAGKKVYGIDGPAKIKATEEVHLDEAFKVGSMKLHDGSTVTLTRESVDSLNGLFNQLNGSNKAKMEERMMSGKKGFQEILSFAENI